MCKLITMNPIEKKKKNKYIEKKKKIYKQKKKKKNIYIENKQKIYELAKETENFN